MKTLSIPTIILLFIGLCSVSTKAQNRKNYQAGCYYDTSGVKHSGLIDFAASGNEKTYDRLNFKINDSAKNQKIPISVVKSVILEKTPQPDTLVVFTEMDTITYERTQYFGRLLFSTPNVRIYSRTLLKIQYNGVASYGAYTTPFAPSTYAVTQYLYEIDGSLTVPITRRSYKEVLSKAFADDPVLVDQIKNKVFIFGDLEKIMSLYQEHKNKTRTQ